MAIAEYDASDFDLSQQAEQDAKLLVKFFTKSVKDKTRTEQEGRAIFKDVEYVDIRIPGSRNGATRPATHRDKQRFPRHYAAFKQRVELPEEGTPLTEWGGISRSYAEELAFLKVKTVEQLAEMSDNNASQLMGGQTLKAKAVAWIERCKQDVSLEQMEEQLAIRDSTIAKLEERLAALEDAKPKRRTKQT